MRSGITVATKASVNSPAKAKGLANADALARFAVVILFLDPLVGDGKTFIQRRAWFPAENFFDEGVVAVASGHALRRVQIVGAFQFFAGDFFHLADQRID